jgi:hypothetical protein
MQLLEKETRLEELEKRLSWHLARELTPRELFYLAMAEACAPTEPAAKAEVAGSCLSNPQGRSV